MIDVSNWHTAADNPPDRVPLLCYCDADDSVFLGFAIHPYLSLDRTVSIVKTGTGRLVYMSGSVQSTS